MSALDDLLRQLAAVVDKLDAGNERIDAAFVACEESQQELAQALDGATALEADEALGAVTTALRELTETRGTVNAVRERVTAYSSHLRPPSSSGEAPSPPERPAPSKRPPNAVGADGSEYPAGAAWAVPELPPRVRESGDRTVGKIKIGDRPIPGSFQSGRGQMDVWVGEAEKRIKTLGIRARHFLPFHVEIRAAAMMVHSGVTSAEVVINNVPCGYQNRPPGCHQVLEPFLPEGSQMTVMGTDNKGRPFQRTYRGRAKR